MVNSNSCFYISPKGQQKCFKNIKLITFDLDNTLWNGEALNEYADNECCIYIKHNYKRLYDFFLKEYKLSIKNLIEQFSNYDLIVGKDFSQVFASIRIDCLKYLAKKTNYDETKFANELYELWNHKKKDVHLFMSPGTIEYLKELKDRGYVLAAITNGDYNVAELKGLSTIFSAVVRSSDCSYAKPKVEIFNLAEKMLKDQNMHFNADEWLHVGDDIITDIMGAKNKNINSAWITIYRDGKEVSEDGWYSYLKLKCEKTDDTDLKQHNPFRYNYYKQLKKNHVDLPYDYIDVEIRHCRDLDSVLL